MGVVESGHTTTYCAPCLPSTVTAWHQIHEHVSLSQILCKLNHYENRGIADRVPLIYRSSIRQLEWNTYMNSDFGCDYKEDNF